MKNWITMLLALVVILALSACGGSGETDGKQPAETTQSAEETETTQPSPTGAVYYLNFKTETDEAWKALAERYTTQTGVPVTVVTPASGTYQEALKAEMGKSQAPTLFQVNGPIGLANWKDDCCDLSGSEVYAHLTSDGFALTEETAVYGIAYVIESYGIIVNTGLLETAGYSLEDITSFEALKAVTEDITARKEELGFAAFTSAGMDDSSDWRFNTHLANLPIYFEYQAEGVATTTGIKGTYLDAYRDVWDLYINNATCNPAELSRKTGDDSRNEFLNGQAVFYQNGSWEYGSLSEQYADNELAMIPIYTGVGDEGNQGLCTGTENYWCVNKNAKPEDIDATLDFLNWCVTSEVGLAALTEEMGFTIPFDTAAEPINLFEKQASAYASAGKTSVAWCFPTIPSENWKDMLGSALTDYAADPTDANWAVVVKNFVEGWAAEYGA